jgi:hypothetical protein
MLMAVVFPAPFGPRRLHAMQNCVTVAKIDWQDISARHGLVRDTCALQSTAMKHGGTHPSKGSVHRCHRLML